jgi:hypothetical protein
LQALVVGLRGLQRQLRIQHFLLQLRIGQVQKNRIRRNLGAG